MNTQARILTSTVVGEYKLLNSEKLRRVLDLMEGITQPANSEESRILEQAKSLEDTNMAILALYDRMGGGVRHGVRKVKTGTFYDFKARKCRTEPDVDEEDYEDEYVLQRKQSRKKVSAETDAERIKRLDGQSSKEESDVDEGDSSQEVTEDTKPAKKRASPAKKRASKK